MQIRIKGLNKNGARQEIKHSMEQNSILVAMVSETITKNVQKETCNITHCILVERVMDKTYRFLQE